MKSIVLPDGGVRLLLDAQGKESISFINFNKTDEGNFFLRTSNNQVSYIDKQDFLNFIFHLENLYQPTFKMVFTDKDTGVRIVNGGIEEFLKKDNCDKVHMKSEFPSTHEEAFQQNDQKQEEIKRVYFETLDEFCKNDTNDDGYAEDRKCIYNQIDNIEHNDDCIDVKLFIYHISQYAILLGYGYKGLEDELSNRLGVKCVISVRQKAI